MTNYTPNLSSEIANMKASITAARELEQTIEREFKLFEDATEIYHDKNEEFQKFAHKIDVRVDEFVGGKDELKKLIEENKQRLLEFMKEKGYTYRKKE